MEEEERPRKLQKTEHEETIELNSSENGEPMMSGALKNGDKPVIAEQQTLNETIKSAATVEKSEEQTHENEKQKGTTEENGTAQSVPLSKRQQKRMLRQQRWDEQKEERKKQRKEKNKQRKIRKREEWQHIIEDNGGNIPQKKRSVLVPVTLVIDCGWDHLMDDRQRISLGSQITRAYSDNSKAPYRSHLAISSFDKLLKERFDTVLRKMHENWRGIQFMPEDFVHAAEQAKERMKGPHGGKLEGAFADKEDFAPENGEVIYLSSDSPNTLTELKPYSTYIIGGLVDKNKHKGVCYQKAIEKGMKTAKLPIGEYLRMASRPVLATNHVAEIMMRWLELGDWGEAFLRVIPQRKGAQKRERSDDAEETGDEVESETAADNADMASSGEEDGGEAEQLENGAEAV
jgi:tRNA (guanine9-N1)-methyltransferase